jgi:hypothetical protein
MERKATVSDLRQDWHGPDGFKAVDTPHGPDFHCVTSDVAVEP